MMYRPDASVSHHWIVVIIRGMENSRKFNIDGIFDTQTFYLYYLNPTLPLIEYTGLPLTAGERGLLCVARRSKFGPLESYAGG